VPTGTTAYEASGGRRTAGRRLGGEGREPPITPAGLPPSGPRDRLEAARRRQRRHGMLLATVLMLGGASGALYLASVGDDRVDVMALAHPVSRGDVITSQDLATVRVSVAGGQVRMLAPAAADAVVGKAALVDLPAGTFVTPEVVSAATPPLGEATVGLRLAADALPASELRAGEWVRVVRTDPSTGEAEQLVGRASIASIRESDDGDTGGGDVVVYVAVPAGSADELAGAASVRDGVRLLGVQP
jgi:hypothetical protein